MKRNITSATRPTNNRPAAPGNKGDTPAPTNGHPLPEEVPGQAPPQAHESLSYGSADLARSAQEVANRPIVTPPVDVPKLRATAIASGLAGESAVREQSDRTFRAANYELRWEAERTKANLEDAIEGGNKQLREISAFMDPCQRYLRIQRDGVPWTAKDRTKVKVGLSLSVVMLLVGVNTIATVLLSSGNPGFDNPIRAYLFAFTPIGLAAVLKGIATYLDTYTGRRRYALLILSLGIALAVGWAGMFAQVFSNMTQSTEDIVRRLMSVDQASASNHPSSSPFILLTILADALLAAGLWLTAETIVDRHERSEIEDDKGHQKCQTDVDRWAKAIQEYERLAGRLNGKLEAIEEARKAHVEDVANQFRVALKATATARHLEEFLGGS